MTVIVSGSFVVIYKIPAVHIVNIPVSVVINASYAVCFGGISPKIGSQIGMGEVDAGINHRHNHIGAAGNHIPRARGIDLPHAPQIVPARIVRSRKNAGNKIRFDISQNIGLSGKNRKRFRNRIQRRRFEGDDINTGNCQRTQNRDAIAFQHRPQIVFGLAFLKLHQDMIRRHFCAQQNGVRVRAVILHQGFFDAMNGIFSACLNQQFAFFPILGNICNPLVKNLCFIQGLETVAGSRDHLYCGLRPIRGLYGGQTLRSNRRLLFLRNCDRRCAGG